MQKVPYMLVIGDREAAEGTVAVRSRTGGDQGSQAVDAFVDGRPDGSRHQRPSVVVAVVVVVNCPSLVVREALSLSTEAHDVTTAPGSTNAFGSEKSG